MTQDEIDTMWQKAMRQSIKEGEMFTRYQFANLVAAKEREYYEDALVQICVQCRSNEWGPLTHKKEILSWFHDFASKTLNRGEA